MSLKLLAPADSKFPTKLSREDTRNQLNQKSRILHKSGKKAFKSNRIDRTLNQRVPGSSPAPTNKASNLICLQTTDTTAPKACEFGPYGVRIAGRCMGFLRALRGMFFPTLLTLPLG